MSHQFTCPQGHQWPVSGLPTQRQPQKCPVCGAPPAVDGLGLPAQIAAAIARLRDEITRAAGTNLAGLIIYGGLARGSFRLGRSDVNLVVLVHDASASNLEAIAPPLRAAWRAARIEPMVLTPSEVRTAVDVFPTKFLDIKNHHILLTGEDPFTGLEVDRALVRLRVEQSLRNLLLRLRRRYLSLSNDPGALATALAGVARPLAIELDALLQLESRHVPPDDQTSSIFHAATAAFGLDGEALDRLVKLRRGSSPEGDVPGLYGRILNSIARAVDFADGMQLP